MQMEKHDYISFPFLLKSSQELNKSIQKRLSMYKYSVHIMLKANILIPELIFSPKIHTIWKMSFKQQKPGGEIAQYDHSIKKQFLGKVSKNTKLSSSPYKNLYTTIITNAAVHVL